jgi:hypothetical protein
VVEHLPSKRKALHSNPNTTKKKKKRKRKKKITLLSPVAHTYNPSYSGGRHQEDHSSKPAWQIVSETLSQKETIAKQG